MSLSSKTTWLNHMTITCDELAAGIDSVTTICGTDRGFVYLFIQTLFHQCQKKRAEKISIIFNHHQCVCVYVVT